eukprot:3467531-Amphidinium_carterae.3
MGAGGCPGEACSSRRNFGRQQGEANPNGGVVAEICFPSSAQRGHIQAIGRWSAEAGRGCQWWC